jgi:hypothetical protein
MTVKKMVVKEVDSDTVLAKCWELAEKNKTDLAALFVRLEYVQTMFDEQCRIMDTRNPPDKDDLNKKVIK